MNKVATFEKVSFEQFELDWKKTFGTTDNCKAIYQSVNLPCRASVGSAGYDFFAPIDIALAPQQSILIPTAMRVKINDGWALLCFPRSGLGFKYRLQLNNTVAIIDSDYYNALNEGHIFAKITNDSYENKTLTIHAGDGFMQGVFMPFGITSDDAVDNIRTGGLGSTTVVKL